MENARLKKIREAERASHMEVYSRYELFQSGSWMEKPVKTVLELLPMLGDCQNFRGLDLGCGVGRNSIPIAQTLGGRVDCVDILPYAIEKLRENGMCYGVVESIRGVVSSIDDYSIAPGQYNLILAISALEHVASEEIFYNKLREIRAGIQENGIVCLVINSGVREWDLKSGNPTEPQFEVNLPIPTLRAMLSGCFAEWEVLRDTVRHQEYKIPRESGLVSLETDVVTFVARRKKEDA